MNHINHAIKNKAPQHVNPGSDAPKIAEGHLPRGRNGVILDGRSRRRPQSAKRDLSLGRKAAFHSLGNDCPPEKSASVCLELLNIRQRLAVVVAEPPWLSD